MPLLTSTTLSRPRPDWRRTLAPLALALVLAGCNAAGKFRGADGYADPRQPGAMSGEELDKATEYWSKKYADNPKDKVAAIALARILRARDRKPQAVVIMRQAAAHQPADADVLAELGKALADAGNPDEALTVLERAKSAGGGSWALHSTHGTVLDQLDRHKEARESYARALEIAPEEPSVLNNLGLSYALDKDLTRAEQVLRRAAGRPGADREVRENLALVLGLQGKFDEAEQVAREALPEHEVSANMSYLKQMLSQPGSWAKMQALEAKNRPAGN